jgi:hypothetical protein
LNNRLEQVEEKRAATCHIRKRKSFHSIQATKEKLIKIKDEIPLHLQEEFETANRLRRYKKEKIEK